MRQMIKKPALKVIKKNSEPAPKALPAGTRWADWYDDEALARAWEERKKALRAEAAGRARIRRSTVVEDCEHRFTVQELAEMAGELSEKIKTIQGFEAQLETLKESTKSYKQQILDTEKEIRELGQKIRDGWEMRPTQVEEQIDYDEGLVSYIRLDTGEEIRSRGLRNSERQMPLSLGGHASKVLNLDAKRRKS